MIYIKNITMPTYDIEQILKDYDKCENCRQVATGHPCSRETIRGIVKSFGRKTRSQLVSERKETIINLTKNLSELKTIDELEAITGIPSAKISPILRKNNIPYKKKHAIRLCNRVYKNSVRDKEIAKIYLASTLKINQMGELYTLSSDSIRRICSKQGVTKTGAKIQCNNTEKYIAIYIRYAIEHADLREIMKEFDVPTTHKFRYALRRGKLLFKDKEDGKK